MQTNIALGFPLARHLIVDIVVADKVIKEYVGTLSFQGKFNRNLFDRG